MPGREFTLRLLSDVVAECRAAARRERASDLTLFVTMVRGLSAACCAATRWFLSSSVYVNGVIVPRAALPRVWVVAHVESSSRYVERAWARGAGAGGGAPAGSGLTAERARVTQI